MRLDKRWLLAGLVAAATVFAVIGPAAASAAVWKEKGVNVTKPFELGLSGGYSITTTASLGSVQCAVHSTLTSSGGSAASITKFAMTSCTTAGTGLLKCVVATSEARALPWSVAVNSADFTISNVRLKHTFKAGCPTAEIDVTFPSVTMTPDVTSAISELFLSGKTLGAEMAAEFTVDSPNKGLFGIG